MSIASNCLCNGSISGHSILSNSLYSHPLSVFLFFQTTPINIAPVTRTWSFTEIPQISGVLDQNLTKIWWLCWLFSGFFAGWFFSLLFQECSVLCKPGECCCILLWPNSDSQLLEQCCQYQLDIWLATQTGLKLKEFTKFNQIHE